MKPIEIKRLRERLQLSQQEFAKRLNVTRRTVLRWEAGDSEPSPIFQKMLREMT